MRLKFTKSTDIKEHYVTDEQVWQSRRAIIKGMGFAGAMSALSSSASANPLKWFSDEDKALFVQSPLNAITSIVAKDPMTKESVATSYNNFYEFGTSKDAPVKNAQEFKVNPWILKIDGLVESPTTIGYDDLFSKFSLEERIYRLRCVEAWSMVIPWVGFPLAKLLALAKPLSSAKYVAFETLEDPKQMPGQRSRFAGGGIDYPYVEGLRMDEALHDLSFMSVGMYGKTLPPQNGAPIRLVLPWKYGFKSIKSIVRITLTDKQPPTTWNILAPSEYGFYANVNPKVDHPRWSQARERRILGTGLRDQQRLDTLPFNGYTEVASLYKNMDLTKYY
ncbi:protein-methionine-sulfoxide reductase catalytic subunit MsrP [Agaribacter marinus]|uniref:Protein-methionine-sulfoxide reductase catalytic subunit MsrP n=1 Tax=Agaribacter marinus TaxID=1431249 RepID=A0AA37WG84_9ALTE|nr:protein-methionine-sulfoxide reductase catalytic subunit MsrP [Agaribacter marinus]GLR69931.1 protein-methionine-sulfoxide reductase catalytic subunit MsrP [Agaribacter marinus]